MTSALHGVYSIYHHTLRLLWPEWRERVDRVDLAAGAREAGVELETTGPLDLAAAVREIQNGSPLLKRHGIVGLSAYYWGTDQRHDQVYRTTDPMRRDADGIREFLEHELQRDSRALREVSTSSEAFLLPLTFLNCKLRNLWVRVNAGIGTNEATAAAGVEVERPVSEVVGGLDPQLWTTRVPALFEDTYRTPASPVDPDDAPTPTSSNSPAWEGLLYEVASWPLPPAMSITLRNILKISFDPGAGQRQLRYSLYECLTGEIGALGGSLFKAYGGIDRDSGFVDVREAPGDPQFASVSGLKSIRFTKHLSFLNPFTPGYLFFWMTFLILGGACYSTHPELSPGGPT